MSDLTKQIQTQVGSIPERLREIKGNRSTAAFARFLDVGVSTLHNYENGRTPPIDFLLNVAARTGVSIEWLLTGTGQKYEQVAEEELAGTRRILVVDDKEYQRDSICNVLETEGYLLGRAKDVEESIQKLAEEPYDVVVTDLRMPEENDGLVLLRHIRKNYPKIRTIIMTVHAATAPVAVEAIRAGAFDYLVMSRTFPEDLRSVVSRAVEEIEREEGRLVPETGVGEIIGRSPGILEVTELIKKAIQSPKTAVLLRGEPGTGKEFFAKVLHANDPHRQAYAFVPVKCGAMSGGILAGELLGAGGGDGEREETPGVFGVADGGTVFLDEVDKTGPLVQSALLRVLDEGTFVRTGEVQPRKTDVRLICATHADLAAEASEGRFRRDLLSRLEALSASLPPLRERGDDLDLLAQHFLAQFAEEEGRQCRKLTPEALDLLRSLPWPDNVRGLRSVIQRAVILSEDDELGRNDVAKALQALGHQ